MGCTLGREPRPVEISAGDLDVAVLGQLSAANLAFRDEFEPGPINVIGFDAALRRRAVPKQVLEHAPRDGHGAVILADADVDSTADRSGFHRASGGNEKNIATSLG